MHDHHAATANSGIELPLGIFNVDPMISKVKATALYSKTVSKLAQNKVKADKRAEAAAKEKGQRDAQMSDANPADLLAATARANPPKRRTKTKFVVEPFSWQFLGGNPRSAAPDTAGITDSGEAAQAAKEDAAGNTPF